MLWSDGVPTVSIASIDFIAIAAIIFATMVVTLFILASSTGLFFFYLLAVIQKILRHKR